MQECDALLALLHAPYLGPVKIRLLVQHFGSAAQALDADPEEARILPGFHEKECLSLRNAKTAEEWKRDRELVDAMGVELILYNDPRFPEGLNDLPDSPILLYLMGSLPQRQEKSVAIVGTRRCSVYGSSMAESLSKGLANYGYPIVSGLARGIDTEAHKAALDSKGRTIAVIGSGLAKVYPTENQKLAKEITETGALISEFPLRTPPDRPNFPQRNRLVAAMTRGTILVEAPLKSGAMITMRRAKALNRALFTIPGRVDIPSFAANHALLKEGAASLIESAEDVAQSFGDLFPDHVNKYCSAPSVKLEPEELRLLETLPSEEITVDELANRTQLPVGKLSVLLMSLLLKKMIREYPGKRYKKLSPSRT